ncbi:MAG: tetratricopeptide repeat protein [Rhizobiaceae bacterium]
MTYSVEQKKDIRRTVDAILASPGFINSPQLQNFLEFIVNKTLAGEASDIKGYTIGVDALGRGEDFDPATDPSVRVMAGRLRQTLANYFNDPSHASTVVIKLEKGSYIPVFNFPETDLNPVIFAEVSSGNQPVDASPSYKSLIRYLGLAGLGIGLSAILLFATNPQWLRVPEQPAYTGTVTLPNAAAIPLEQAMLPGLAVKLTIDEEKIPEWITASELSLRTFIAFSRFKEYRVFEVSGDDISSVEGASDYKLDVLFTKADNKDDLETFLTLQQTASGKIVWSEKLVFPRPVGKQEQINQEIITRTVTELMSPYGIIYRDIASPDAATSRLKCIQQIYSYFMQESLQAYSDGARCARNLVDTGTASSSMHALLAFLYAEAYRRGFQTDVTDPLGMAELLAEKAIELDPLNARAFQARFAVEKNRGTLDRDAVIAAAENAIQLNPLDRDIAGDIAAYFIAINEPDHARPYLDRALSLTPVPPAWLNFYQYLHADMTGNFTEADTIAERFDVEQSSLVALAVLMSAERRGLEQEKQKAASAILKKEPSLLADPETSFKRRGFDSKLAKILADRISEMKLIPVKNAG